MKDMLWLAVNREIHGDTVAALQEKWKRVLTI
jgi:hypothetical protein